MIVCRRAAKQLGLTAGLIVSFGVATLGECRAGIQIVDENAKAGGTFNTSGAPDGWVKTALKGWMGSLPDSTRLHTISIPGTHDSGALHGGLAVQTNSWSIREQLDAGIRYLDIRARRTKSAFAIHHGSVYQKQMFGDVMNQVVAFLKSQPHETVLMRVKEEHTAESGSQSFGAIWADYMKRYGGHVYTGDNTIPTLGQVRGKIFVLRNNGEIPTKYGISYSSNEIQDHYIVYWLAHKMVDGDKISLPSKKDKIKEYILKARSSANAKLVLNHLSGAQGMAPRDVARATNQEAFEYIGPYNGKKSLGILIMDFPGERLIYRTVKSNFAFNKECSARTFRSVSQHSWVEFRLPKATEGRVIEISGGAYNNYVFPKCNRVHWSDLSFLCQSNGSWTRTKGSWDADALCHGSKGDSPYVHVGNR